MSLEQEPKQAVSIASVILSARFQALAGPLATTILVAGYGAFWMAQRVGFPRPELFPLLAIGVAVALASIAVTLGVILLVSRQTPRRQAALASIVLGLVAFILAVPAFLLVAGSV